MTATHSNNNTERRLEGRRGFISPRKGCGRPLADCFEAENSFLTALLVRMLRTVTRKCFPAWFDARVHGPVLRHRAAEQALKQNAHSYCLSLAKVFPQKLEHPPDSASCSAPRESAARRTGTAIPKQSTRSGYPTPRPKPEHSEEISTTPAIAAEGCGPPQPLSAPHRARGGAARPGERGFSPR